MNGRPRAAQIAFLPLLFVTLFLAQGALALDVLSSQEDMTLTIERGDSLQFALILQNVQEKATVKATGEIADWTGFWDDGEGEYDVYPGQGYIIVRIDVPQDAETGEYDGQIVSGSDVLSRITVRATAELTDVKAYEKLSDVGEQVGNLRSDLSTISGAVSGIKSKVESLESDLPGQMESACGNQQDITELENENQKLSDEIDGLSASLTEAEESNKELNDFTGMLVGTQIPGTFVGGLILGIAIVTLVINREMVKKRLKQSEKKPSSKSRDQPAHREDTFRYSYGKT